MRLFMRGIVVVGCLGLSLCLGDALARIVWASQSRCCSESSGCSGCVWVQPGRYANIGNNAYWKCQDGPPDTEFQCDEEERICFVTTEKIPLYDDSDCSNQIGEVAFFLSTQMCMQYDPNEPGGGDDSCD